MNMRDLFEKKQFAKNMQDHGYSQAHAQMSSIAEMVAGLNLDWDEYDALKEAIEELLDEVKAARLIGKHKEFRAAKKAVLAWLRGNQDEWLEMKDAASDFESQDDAHERIQEDPLSVELYGTWTPGETPEPDGFIILLCTGGPAVRVKGEFGSMNEPRRAWLEYQDWGTPWTEYHGPNMDYDALLTYCHQFYFGE